MIRQLWQRVVEVTRSRRLDRESAEELAYHVEALVDEKRRCGFDESEARRQARIELGSVDITREKLAERRTGFVLEQTTREVGYAIRVLRRSPGITLLSVATMGLGIGASAILFGLVNAIVLRPLPYPEPAQLVRIFDINHQLGVDQSGVASGNIDDWRQRTTRFDGITGFYSMGRTLNTELDAEVVITAQVSQDFFPIFRTAPHIGRTFTDDETRRAQFSSAAAPIGAGPVAILGYQLWQRRFGGNPGIIGSTVMLDRRPFTIVGVMPAGFAMPDRAVQIWIPWDLSIDRLRDQHYLSAIARLKSGVSIGEAEADLQQIASELGAEYPATNAGWSVRLRSLHDETVGDTARVLWILLAAVSLVLVIACANVALLALMRGLDRSGETAMRFTLGASKRRLLRELMIESVVVAVLGGVLAAAIAWVGVRALPALTTELPRIDEVALDRRALLVIMGLTGIAALISGLPTAWRRSDTTALHGIAISHRTTPSDRHLLRDAIVVGQVALSVVLLVGSGLLFRSFLHLRGTDPGFDPRRVLVAPIFLDKQAYESGERVRTYYATLFERLAALPGVETVGGATSVPTSPLGPDFERPVWPEDAAPDTSTPASVRVVTPGYFRSLRLGIADGRPFDGRDRPGSADVVMVSQTLARRLWPGQRAVGQRLVVDYSTAGTYPYEVVGVVNDVRFRGPRSTPLAEIYLVHAQRPYLILNVTVRTAIDPRTLIPAVRSVLKEIDPHKPAHGIYVLEDLLAVTISRDRQAMIALLVFAAAAVGLAILSVYGVLAQRVRERSREIGIRVAMGANASQLVGWVAGLGLRLMTIGAAVGLAAAWMLTGLLSRLLFGVGPTDPATIVAVVALLGAVGLISSLLPSWRATRIDPAKILRHG